MKIPSEAELLRIFIGESDKYQGRPLYEVDKLIGEGLVTLEKVRVILYRHDVGS